MSEIFKLKICVGDANIELEGEGELVHSIFSELREYGLGKLSSPVLIESSIDLPDKGIGTNAVFEGKIDIESEKMQTVEVVELPQLTTIVIKNLPKTELEWLVVYGLYASKQGTKIFQKEDLRQQYQNSGRWDENRSKNFSKNIKKAISEDWFIIVNSDSYSLSENGKKEAYEILQRTVESDKNKKQKKSTSSSKPIYQMVDLGLDETKRKELKQYLLSFADVSSMEKAVLIAYKLIQYGIEEFNADILFTALRIAELPISFNLKSALGNGKNLKNYFISGEGTGMYKLHHLGEDHAKELEKRRDVE